MDRLKTGMLVSAAVRVASAALIDCVVVNRGDADAGAGRPVRDHRHRLRHHRRDRAQHTPQRDVQ